MSNQQLPIMIKQLLEREDVQCLNECIDSHAKIFGQHASVAAEFQSLIPTMGKFAKRQFNCIANIKPEGHGLSVNVYDEEAAINYAMIDGAPLPVHNDVVCTQIKESLHSLHCLSWNKEKVVLRFNPSLLEALSGSELPETLPDLHLPFNRCYVAFPKPVPILNNDIAFKHPLSVDMDRKIYGFYIHLRQFDDGSQYLGLFFIGETTITFNVRNQLKTITQTDVGAWFSVDNSEGALGNVLAKAIAESGDGDPDYVRMMRDAMSMLLYLSQDPSDIDITKRGNGAKKDKVITDKQGNPRFPSEYSIGDNIGRQLDLAYHQANNSNNGDSSGTKRIHVRRGHFAVRYYGSIKEGRGKGFQKSRLVWLHPMVINANQVEAETTMQVV